MPTTNRTPLLTPQGVKAMSSDFAAQMVAASRALIRDYEAITTPENLKNSFFAESVQQTFGANIASLRTAVHRMQALNATAKRECLL
jgi:hypothetical protein